MNLSSRFLEMLKFSICSIQWQTFTTTCKLCGNHLLILVLSLSYAVSRWCLLEPERGFTPLSWHLLCSPQMPMPVSEIPMSFFCQAGLCPGFGWDRVNFPLSSCCVLDLVPEEC